MPLLPTKKNRLKIKCSSVDKIPLPVKKVKTSRRQKRKRKRRYLLCLRYRRQTQGDKEIAKKAQFESTKPCKAKRQMILVCSANERRKSTSRRFAKSTEQKVDLLRRKSRKYNKEKRQARKDSFQSYGKKLIHAVLVCALRNHRGCRHIRGSILVIDITNKSL